MASRPAFATSRLSRELGIVDPRIVRFEGFEGIHLVADVWGDDRDWPVLLMHGGGQTRHAWRNTALLPAALSSSIYDPRERRPKFGSRDEQ
jgi:non-heme chloroperoxidase